MSSQGFEDARRLERLELDIILELRKSSPETDRAFPVSIQQWGRDKLDVNGIYATNRGEFFFVDFGQGGALTVRALGTKRALDMVNLLGFMGVVGNRSCLSELVYAESPLARAPLELPPPGAHP